jgi:hypothetical protein
LVSPRRKASPISQNAQPAEEAINRILAKAPPEQTRLADGRETKTVLIGLVREWEEIRGGSFECHPTGSRWAHLADDSWAIGDFRPFGLSTDLCAVSTTQMARTFASGYENRSSVTHRRCPTGAPSRCWKTPFPSCWRSSIAN